MPTDKPNSPRAIAYKKATEKYDTMNYFDSNSIFCFYKGWEAAMEWCRENGRPERHIYDQGKKAR